MPRHVDLTLPEMSVALNIAWLRIVTSAAKKLNHATTYQRSMAQRIYEEFIGACGELAVGKASGTFFVPSVNTFHRVPDCLDNCEVRSTDNTSGRLIVRDNDSDDRRYIFAVMTGDTMTLVGWLTGAEAKKDEWTDNPNGYRPAWFVPQDRLHDVEEILGRDDACHANLPSSPR